jgi:predicted DsbA family dithiol-disulfide isomerase
VGVLRLRPWAWALLALSCALAPLVWPRVRPEPPVPRALLRYYEKGRINVVEFADFECPHCRDLHPRLKAMLADYGDRVHFTRLHAPLPMHKGSRGAARAAVSAEAQGKNDPMADRLFSLPELSPESIRKAALELGLDAKAFDACLTDPKTDARIDADIAMLESAGFEGLPTTYVGAERILGAQPDEVFRDALDATARGEGQSGVPGWAYVGGFFALVAALVLLGRVKPQRTLENKHKTIP